MLLVVSAGVRLLPDYVWEKVAPKIRAALLEALNFEARELGQDVFLSEVISVMQSVQGVAYVDVDALGGVAEKNADGSLRTPNELNKAAKLIVGGPDEPTAAARLPNKAACVTPSAGLCSSAGSPAPVRERSVRRPCGEPGPRPSSADAQGFAGCRR